MKKVLSTLLVASIGGMAALSFHHFFQKESTTGHFIQNTPPVKFVNMPSATAGTPLSFVEAAETSVHGVVHVKTTYRAEQVGNPFYGYDPFRDFFWGRQPAQPRQEMSSGSGVIISPDGYIVTNNHVVERADEIEVVLNDKRNYKAAVVGRDPATDIALLKIKEQNLPYVPYGNSDDLKVGEWVLAVGNPFNLTSTVTAGIVSAKGRNINILEGDPSRGRYPIESFIQTDAAVNPGNSGGALVNTGGQLVGINSAIASATGSYSGYSFAIPVNMVKKIVADLVEYGEVQRAYIGVSIRDMDAKLAKDKKLDDVKGVFIQALTEGGAAEEAGINVGDVVTKVGEVSVNSVSELQEQISKFRPGDKVALTVKRNNAEKIIPVQLKNMNGNTTLAVKEEKTESVSALGANFEPVTQEDKRRLNIDNGLKITHLDGGKLRSAGIREGFIITTIDKKKINSDEDLKTALDNKKGGVLIEGVYPNGMRSYYAFGL